MDYYFFFVVALRRRLSLVKPPEERGDEGTNRNLDYRSGLFSHSAFPRWGIIVRMRREAGEKKLQECRLSG